MAPENLKVLVVDDEQFVGDLMEADLCPTRTGITLFRAYDSENALRILRDNQIGVAFIDRYGPWPQLEERGVPFLLEYAKGFPDTAFYLHSGEDNPEVTARVIAAGARGFLKKHDSKPEDYLIACGYTKEELAKLFAGNS